MRTLIFDIETIPDVALGKKLLPLDGLADDDVAKAMTFKHLQDSGTEFLPLYQQQIVAISVVLRSTDQLKVWSLGDIDSDESELIKRFFDGLEQYTPDLVSWNGGGFDRTGLVTTWVALDGVVEPDVVRVDAGRWEQCFRKKLPDRPDKRLPTLVLIGTRGLTNEDYRGVVWAPTWYALTQGILADSVTTDVIANFAQAYSGYRCQFLSPPPDDCPSAA